MANIEYDILTRRATAAEWTTTNPILKQGELGYELDTGRYKTGDGTTSWTGLGYQIVTKADRGVANGVAPLGADAKIPGIYIDAIGDASTLTFTPYETIEATNVQDAIEEFYDELPNLGGSLFNMTGIVDGGELTLNVDATLVDVAPCTYYIQGTRYTYPGVTGLAPSFGAGQSSRRFGLDANGLFEQSGNFTDEQKRTIMPIARVQAVQGSSGPGSSLIAPIDLRYTFGEFGYVDRIWREAVFGALYAETGGDYTESSTALQLDQSTGLMYDAQGKKQVIPLTTNLTAKYVYHVAGTWSVQPDSILVVNTTQYDNGTDLTALTDNYWTCHTLLRSPKAQNEFFLVVGQTQHPTQTEAEASDVQYGPFVNEQTSNLVAVAKLVVRKGSNYINRIVNIQPRIKGADNASTGVSALLPTVSNPTSLVNYEDAWRLFNSGSVVTGCDIINNGDGTFNISAGEVAIRTSASDTAPLVVYAIDAAGPFTPIDNDTNYYFINYNNGSPTWASGNTIATYNGMDKMQAYTVARRGTSLWFIDSRGQSIDANRKIRRRDLEWSGNTQKGFWHTAGGTVIGSSGLNISVTAGKFYYGVAPVTNPAFDTSVAGTANLNVFDYYRTRSSWTYTADSKTINNTQYDNNGTLTTMTNGRYRTDWVYLVLDGDSPRLIVIMGNAEYATLAAAQADPIPALLPTFMDGSAVLVGRTTVLKDATTLVTATAFGSTFNQATSTVHNNLSGLSGGAANEYFHLSSAEYTGTGTGVIVRTTAPTVSDLTVNTSATVLANTSNPALKVTQTGTGDLLMLEDVASPDASPFVVDADGRVKIGKILVTANAGLQLTSSGTSAPNSNIFTQRYSTDTTSGELGIYKARGDTTTASIVSSGDSFGAVVFGGYDGSAFVAGTRIEGASDGTPGVGDMPGRLVFSTTADGASTPTERLRINSSGKVLIGNTTGTALTFGASNVPTVQINTIDANGLGVSRWTANTAPAYINLAKSRGSSIGSRTVLQSGDDIGQITFDADDGTNFIQAASILAEVDGTPGTGDMPGRLVFSTTADGASTPTERMRISSTGAVTIGGALTVAGTMTTTGNTVLGDTVLADTTTVPDQKALAYTTDVLPTIRPSLLLDFANSKMLDPRITFSRATVGTYFDAQGMLRTAAAGVPRFDHDPITGKCKGLLIEESRANLLTYSEQFDNGVWGKTRSSIMANSVVAPDGTLTADKLVEAVGSVTDYYVASSASLVSGTAYTFTVFAKAGERTQVGLWLPAGGYGTVAAAVFTLTGNGLATQETGTSTNSIVNVGNGWYRCSITATAASTIASGHLIRLSSGGTTFYTGDGTSGLYIWGAQLEAGTFPTSYIKTEAASVTRSADVASMTGANFSSWYRQDEGTFVVTSQRMATTSGNYPFIVGVSDGSVNNALSLLWSGSTSNLYGTTTVGGSFKVEGIGVAGLSQTSRHTLSSAFGVNNSAASVNGASVVTDNICDLMPPVNQMTIGTQFNGGNSLNGHIASLSYYPKRLDNNTLQGLTS